jgi:hypothetical protein
MTPEAARVSLGASLLDQRLPGYAPQIGLDELHIGSDVYGPLGQLYGTYAGGLLALWPNIPSYEDRHRLGVKYGFHWDRGRSADPDAEVAALEYAWEREIAARRIGRAA